MDVAMMKDVEAPVREHHPFTLPFHPVNEGFHIRLGLYL
jgi:hypothetical protein